MARTETAMPERLIDVAVDTDTGATILVLDLGEGDRLMLRLDPKTSEQLRDQLMAKLAQTSTRN